MTLLHLLTYKKREFASLFFLVFRVMMSMAKIMYCQWQTSMEHGRMILMAENLEKNLFIATLSPWLSMTTGQQPPPGLWYGPFLVLVKPYPILIPFFSSHQLL
jgi:hypothetical protein